MNLGERVGRKAPCPCGSGKPYKNCCRARDREESRRKRFLFYFPMIHGDGSPLYEASPNEVKCWSDIRRSLGRLPAPNKVYADSSTEDADTPSGEMLCDTAGKICPDEFDPMHKTLFWLGQRNPKPVLVLCESPELVREFREFYRAMGAKYGENPDNHWRLEESNLWRDIIKRRDIYIAQRIDATLKTGEAGVLFLGSSHNSENHLVNHLESMGIEVEVIEVLGPPSE